MAKAAALVDEATRLYVEEGFSIAEIAGELKGVSQRTLEGWCAKYDWPERRSRRRHQENELDDYVRKIKLRLAGLLMEDEIDPQLIYALRSGLAVLKPSTAVELRKLDQEEKDMQTMSPEEKREKVKEAIEAIYGISG